MPESKKTRLWLDGCFDGFHYAHANAIRQAVNLVSGPVCIVVGIHSDAETNRNKGPPLFNQSERYALIEGCRWVDMVVQNAPYTAQISMLEKYSIDFLAHGDDIAIDESTGRDCLAEVKSKGMYKEFKRTEGISTTSLIQRILQPDLPLPNQKSLRDLMEVFASSISPPLRIIDAVTEDFHAIPGLTSDATVAYIGGSWDCFGAGHVDYLRRAKAALKTGESQAVTLVVGIWPDESIRDSVEEGPFLLLLERALAVIQCRYSDAVILNAPYSMSKSTYSSLGINVVVNGDDNTIVSDLKTVQVAVPPLQTLRKLRKSVLGRKQLYEIRQQRKGL